MVGEGTDHQEFMPCWWGCKLALLLQKIIRIINLNPYLDQVYSLVYTLDKLADALEDEYKDGL